MPLSTATITLDLADMLGVDLDVRHTRIWVDTNIPDDTVVDTDGNQIRIGSGRVTIADNGTGSFTTWVPGAGSNPATWQTSVHVDYVDGGLPLRKSRTFGPFTITATANLADLIAEQEIPPEYLTTVTTALEAYVDSASASATTAAASATSAAASAAGAVAIVGPVDGTVEALVKNTGGVGPLTSAALSAAIATGTPPALGRINAVAYGVVGNNVANDTTAFTAAVAAAIAQKKTLWVPPGLVGVRLASTVDARFIDILAESPIRIAQTTEVGLRIGDDQNLVNHRKISFTSVTNTTGPDPTYPSVRVSGLKGGVVTIKNCDYFQIWADGSVADSTSTSYTKFHFGRTIRKHELLGIGTGWITENTFYGGCIRNVIVSGDTHKHDSNLWHKTSIENPDGGAGASIVFNVGAFNRMEGMRGEAGVPVTFAAGTYSNIIVPSYGSNLSVIGFYGTVTDNGTGNTITGYQPFSRTVEIHRIDSSSRIFDSSCDWSAPSIPNPGLRKLTSRGAFGTVLDTGLIPLTSTAAGQPAEAPDRIQRLIIASDTTMWMPYVTLYDANRTRIDLSVGGPYMDLTGGWAVMGTAPTNRYGFAGAIGTAKMLITSSTVAFLRLELQSLNANTAFSWVSVSAQVSAAHHLGGLVSQAQRAIQRPTYQTTSPTKGAAYLGDKVANAAGFYTCTMRIDQTISAGVATSATVLPFTGQAGALAANDVVGLLLDNGNTHWAKVVSVSIPNVTIDTALPSAAASGSVVVVNRWV